MCSQTRDSPESQYNAYIEYTHKSFFSFNSGLTTVIGELMVLFARFTLGLLHHASVLLNKDRKLNLTLSSLGVIFWYFT